MSERRSHEEVQMAAYALWEQLGWTWLEPFPGAGHAWRSRCERGHEVAPRYNVIRRLCEAGKTGEGCNKCGKERGAEKRRTPVEEVDRLAASVGIALDGLYVNASVPIPAHCLSPECGKSFTKLLGVMQSGSGCPYCARRRVDPEDARRLMLDADLAPEGEYPGASEYWPSTCMVCRHRNEKISYTSVRLGRGCTPCGYRRMGDKQRLSDDVIRSRARTLGLDVLEIRQGTPTVVLWQCLEPECGFVDEMVWESVQYGRGCRRCNDRGEREGRARRARAGQKLSQDTARLSTAPGTRRSGRILTYTEIISIARAAGVDPIDVTEYVNLKTPLRCRCLNPDCRAEVTPALGGMAQGQGGCRHCGHVRRANKRRLSQSEAHGRFRAGGYEMLDEYRSALVGVRCRCLNPECGMVSDPTLANVSTGYRCRYCSMRSFWSSEFALVYLIVHDVLDSVKIGIGAHPNGKRIAQHEREGWRVIGTWVDLTPQLAWDTEKEVLASWRSRGVPFGVMSQDMPQHGYTETAPMSKVDLDVLVGLIDDLTETAQAA
jgi:hypothetical protein